MIESHELKNRDRYLQKLIGFRNTEPVKVITDIDAGEDTVKSFRVDFNCDIYTTGSNAC